MFLTRPGRFRGAYEAGGFCTTLDMGICFAAGTPVLMADGTTKPIETLQPGDSVLAAPEHDAEATPAAKTVERVFHNPPADLILLTIAQTQLRCTPPHLFYVNEKGWTAAKDLEVGDQLRTPDGRWVTLDAKEAQSRRTKGSRDEQRDERNKGVGIFCSLTAGEGDDNLQACHDESE